MNKKILIKLLLIMTLLTLQGGIFNTVLAQGDTNTSKATSTPEKFQCSYLNNQAGTTKTEQDQSEAYLKGNIVVITEEPMGRADGDVTHRCYRQTECNKNQELTPSSEQGATPNPATSGSTSTTANPQATPKVTNCTTTYVDSCIPKNKITDSDFTTCEAVMIYVTPTGTNLLYYYMGKIYTYMATIGGFLAVLIIILAGIIRASAGDSTERITQANNLIKKSITGLVILFFSAVILYTINPNFFVK